MGLDPGGCDGWPFRHDVWVLKALTEAGDQAPPDLLAQAPEWYVLIEAAQSLGCSVFELEEHADRDYWVQAAQSRALFHEWLRERAERQR